MKWWPDALTPSALGRAWNRFTRDDQSPQRGSRYMVRRTGAGVWVDGDSALQDATVWICVNYLARQVAQPPWRAGRETADGGFEIAPTNPADRLLNRRPNPEMGAFTFRQTLMGWVLRYGNGYAEIEWDARGAPAALWPIHPDRVQVMRDSAGKLFYRVWNQSGGSSDLPAEDMFHVRGFGDGPVGISVMQYAAESIGWARATAIFGSTFFGEGMNPTVVLSTDKVMSEKSADEARKRMKSLYKGADGEKTFIADAGLKVEKLAYTPEEGQFIETRQQQVEEICRWFGVPPHKAMQLLRATFSNIEQQSIEVVGDTIAPWCKVFEEEADYKLFPQRGPAMRTRMDLKALLRGDSAARAAFYKAMWETGAFPINAILRAEGENTIGAVGEVRFVPLNYQPLDRAIAPPRPALPAPADPAAEETADAKPPAKLNGARPHH
jgi:HK97 family phage portal protein